MKQKHYYTFDKSIQEKLSNNGLNKSGWDILRNSEDNGDFSIEKTVEAYEENCRKQPGYAEAAKIIIDLIKENDLVSHGIVSVGVGKGILEWHLKQICPEVRVECTDYTKDALEKLGTVLKNVDGIYEFDMINGDYAAFQAGSVVLMYRVSTEFDRKQWDSVFAKMHEAGIENIIYVPTEVASLRHMMSEKKNHIKNVLRGRKDTFCGWLYSENEFKNMFSGKGSKPIYNIVKAVNLNDTCVYLLKKNI